MLVFHVILSTGVRFETLLETRGFSYDCTGFGSACDAHTPVPPAYRVRAAGQALTARGQETPGAAIRGGEAGTFGQNPLSSTPAKGPAVSRTLSLVPRSVPSSLGRLGGDLPWAQSQPSVFLLLQQRDV